MIGECCLIELDCFIGLDGGEDLLQILVLFLELPQLLLCVLVPHIAHDDILDHIFFCVDHAAGGHAFGLTAPWELAVLGLGSHSGLKVIDLLVFTLLEPVKLLSLDVEVGLRLA